MNDFTKEELETLHACLDLGKFDDGSDEVLLDKIESMIENYCSHEHERTISDVDYIVICRDCERILR